MDISLKDLELIRDALKIAINEHLWPNRNYRIVDALTLEQREEKLKSLREILKNIQDKILLVKETLNLEP